MNLEGIAVVVIDIDTEITKKSIKITNYFKSLQ